jgi:hypothetical protein
MVEAKPSDDPTRLDFEFLDLEARNDDEDYCISGILGNPGAEVREYLVIAAILYDDQERVVNFIDYGIFGDVGLSSGDLVPFDLCVQPPNQGVARYEARAWGL